MNEKLNLAIKWINKANSIFGSNLVIFKIYQKVKNIEQSLFLPLSGLKRINTFEKQYPDHKSNRNLFFDILKKRKIKWSNENVFKEIKNILKQQNTCFFKMFDCFDKLITN